MNYKVKYWYVLSRVKIILEPLTIAANITQAPHTHLDHVLLTLGNLFHIYSNPNLDPAIHNAILGSLEKWWAVADQEVFITAVLLNPYICARYLSWTALTEASLYNIITCIFKQIFGQKADLNLLKAFTNYAQGLWEFSHEEILLDMMAEMHKSEMSCYDKWCNTINNNYLWVEYTTQPCVCMDVDQ